MFERLDEKSYRVHSYSDLIAASIHWNKGVKPFHYYIPNGIFRRYPCVVSFSARHLDGITVEDHLNEHERSLKTPAS